MESLMEASYKPVSSRQAALQVHEKSYGRKISGLVIVM
jgi:hypothetical protein